MAILLGALASVLLGSSDFLGRYGTRRSHAITTVSGALIGGIAISAVGVLVIPSVYARRDIVLGVLSGLVVGLALATLYEAMATSSAAVAAPLVALGVALFPLGWDLAFGAELSWLITAGVALSLGSLLFVTYSPGLTGNIGRGVRIALVSALLWGVSTILIGETSDDAGAWGPLAQRIVAFVVMMVLATYRSVRRVPPRPLLPIVLLSGVLGACGMIAFVLGTQRGSLGSVAVASSMFPAVSAALSAAFDDDTLHWWQMIGIAGVIGGVAMMALG